MRSGLGVILRLAGFGIEAACAIPLMRVRGKGLTFAGMPAEYWLYAGLAAGFLLWIAGVIVTRIEARRPLDWPPRGKVSWRDEEGPPDA